MTKPREKTREELTAEIEEGKKKIRQFENREKIIKQMLQKLRVKCVKNVKETNGEIDFLDALRYQKGARG